MFMSDNETNLDQPILPLEEVALCLEIQEGNHVSDQDLWELAAADLDRSPGSRTALDHALTCRSCYLKLAEYRNILTAPVEVPPAPAGFQDLVTQAWYERQARLTLVSLSLVAGALIVKQLRAQLRTRSRFRSLAEDTDQAVLAPGRDATIPVFFGEPLYDLIVTYPGPPVDGYRVSLQPPFDIDPAELDSLDCVLSDEAGRPLERTSISPGGFVFQTELKLGVSYRITREDRATGETLGVIGIVPGTAKG
jgi:hypothetical protein